MKQAKKWLVLLLALILVLSIGLVACQDTKCECPDCGCETCEDCANCDCPTCSGGNTDEITLVAPVIRLNGNVISWDAVANATRYVVYEDGVAVASNVTTTSYTINKSGDVEKSWEYKVAAYNADATPKTGPQSNAVTYTYTPGPVDGGGGDDDHTCSQPCPVCSGCLDKDCTEDACKTKCTGHDVVPNDKLSAPLVAIEGNALNWFEVADAVAYDVYKNGDKIDTIDRIEVIEGLVYSLPTTYTIKDANDGDKFQVVAVSDSEDVDDSELSEEVTYVAAGTTISLTSSVYVLNGSAIRIPVAADSSNGLYKVIIKENNNYRISTGDPGIDFIKVQGSLSDSNPPYAAEAEYDVDLGAWVAKVVITGDNQLRLDIDSIYDSGYTVSLAEPYDLGGSDNRVVASYTLGATGSIDVEIPYMGYSIQINVGNDVPSPRVLYVVLANGEENVGIYNGSTPFNERVGYYASNSFTGSSITLSNNKLDGLKATVSFALPDAALANLPTLYADEPNYEANHIEHGAQDPSAIEPTQLRVSGLSNGEYILVLSTTITDGVNFYAKLDSDKSYTKITNKVGGLYSLNVTISDNKILYLYEFTGTNDNKEGIDITYVALYSAGNKTYSISNGDDVEKVFIGNSASNATLFNLSGVEDGSYTLTITGSANGTTFKVGVGDKWYTIENILDKWPAYYYTVDIELEGTPDSISIYCEDGVCVVDVKIELIVEESEDDLPTLTHGGAGAKFTLTAQFGSDASVSFALKDVADGTYTVALRGFGQNQEYSAPINVIVGSTKVAMCNVSDGYLGDKTIRISGDTKLTVEVLNGNDTWKLTIYLLADGEEISEGEDGGNGGSETEATISFDLGWTYGDKDVDVSNLKYGIYTLTLEDTDGESLGSMVYLTTAVEGELLLNSDNGYSASITINSDTIKLNGMGQSGAITIKLVRTGDLPLGGGGTDTELTIEFDYDSKVITSVFTNLDVSSLQYGEYTITLENVYNDWLNGYAQYSITAAGGNEITLDEGNNWTATITIDSDTISLFTTATYEPLTIKLVKNG